MNKRVIMAMSGGVDSSVAAALLKKQSYSVIGVFMKFWQPQRYADEKTDLHGYENRCCSTESERRARRVAKILKIPFYVFNFEKEFKKRIVDYFLKEHKAGLTPNPCVICNKEIKFGLLLEKALALDADFIATGHYARLKKTKNGFYLLRSKDKNKDQSYFLWQLSQKQLGHVLFPIENYTRAEVEKLAKKFELPFSGVRKSQEICFIPNTIEDFLKRHIKAKPGPVVEQVHYGVKKIIGRHQGLWFYTIGQRKGIGLSGGPYWVVGKDCKKNQLIVSKNEKDLYKKELAVGGVNWILGKEPRLRQGCLLRQSGYEGRVGGQAKLPLKIRAQIRYRHKSASAIVYKLNNRNYKLIFEKSQKSITPGQSVVFYRGDEVLGGGIIC